MRYIGPRFKKSRAFEFSTLETGKEFLKGKKRKTRPGQHGAKVKKLKGFGIQLREKQKIKYVYGANERQLKNAYKAATSNKHPEQHFLAVLESRLDNLVYRFGLTNTRNASRQLVNHGHILVDGKKCNIPSALIKPGQKISVKENSKNLKLISEALEQNVALLGFVEFDKNKLEGTFLRYPAREELNQEIKENFAIEYYNLYSS